MSVALSKCKLDVRFARHLPFATIRLIPLQAEDGLRGCWSTIAAALWCTGSSVLVSSSTAFAGAPIEKVVDGVTFYLPDSDVSSANGLEPAKLVTYAVVALLAFLTGVVSGRARPRGEFDCCHCYCYHWEFLIVTVFII